MVGTLVDVEVTSLETFNDVIFSEKESDSDFGKLRFYSRSSQIVLSTAASRQMIFYNGGLGLDYKSVPPQIYTTHYAGHPLDGCGIASFSFWNTPTWGFIYGTTGYVDVALANALFFNPTDISVAPTGTGILFISDIYNHAIRFIIN